METSDTKIGEGARLGKYRLVAELGRGGMAKVFLAITQGPGGFNKLVVVKQIMPEYAEDPEFVSMFLDEARLAAQVRHPNVVQTNEVGEDQGRHFMVMEYLEGQPLSRLRYRLGRANAMPLALHLRVLSDVLAGLHCAHELRDYEGQPLGVVHRDVSPENVFVTYDGAVKVVDFGIAKARDSVSETQVGTVKGKVAYMAPEQALGKRLDRRTDLFAVGVMLWEAATGVRMWKGVSHGQILQRLADHDVPAPRSVCPDIPDALDAVIRKATAPRREARYATAADFQADLEALLVELDDHTHGREIGALIATHFAAERTQIKGVVEEQLRALAREERTATVSRLPVLDHPTPQPQESSDGASSPAVMGSELLTRTLRNQRPVFAAALLGGALVLGGAASILTRGATTRAAAASPPTVAPATAAPTATLTARLSVAATPATARIWLDDRPVAGNPVVAELPIGEAVHQLRIEAPGYAPRVERFTLSRDRAIDVTLAPAPEHGDDVRHPSEPAAAAPHGRKSASRHLDVANPYLQ
jgi:serine/threonine-protein kinase